MVGFGSGTEITRENVGPGPRLHVKISTNVLIAHDYTINYSICGNLGANSRLIRFCGVKLLQF